MNISDPFRFAAQYCPDKKALIFGEARYTYGEMNRIIDGIAHYMKDLGVSSGATISLYMGNRPEWILFYYGIARLGAIPVCVPGAFRREEMTGIVKDSRSCLLVTSEDHQEQLPDSDKIPLVDTVICVESDRRFQSLLHGGAEIVAPFRAETKGDDAGSILYTGGTTGTPKGAVLTHGNLL